jgi:hypothetical protein
MTNALTGYSGYVQSNGNVWYSLDKSTGTSSFTITYPTAISGVTGPFDINDFEWIAAILPTGPNSTSGDQNLLGDPIPIVPVRTVDGFKITVPLQATVSGTDVKGYAVVILAEPKNTDLTLNAEVKSGNGQFYIDDIGGPLYQKTLSLGDPDIDNFIITPDSGWELKSVTLTAGDGSVFDKTNDALNGTLAVSYNEMASGTNTISAVFVPISAPPTTHDYYIHASADGGSTISPSGRVVVSGGGSMTFTYAPLSGYEIKTITIDGTEHPELLSTTSYTFHNVNMDHTISVVSAKTEGGGSGGDGDGGDDGDEGDAGEAGSEDSWAILNLICAVVAILVGLAVLAAGRERVRHKKDGAQIDEEKAHKSKLALTFRVISFIIGIVSVIVFFVTEDLTLPIDFLDDWSLLMVIMLLATLIISLVSFRFDRKDEDDGN